jgi:hypothetical protein
MVYDLLRALPGVPGFVATVALRNVFARLDPSVGESGPHAFAVRDDVFVRAHARAAHHHVHRIPFPTSVTIASRPSRGIRMRGVKHIFLKNGRRIFLSAGLDWGNQIEVYGNNRVLVQLVLWRLSV